MANLSPNTLLVRASNLRVQIHSSTRIQIFNEGDVIECPSHGLTLLDVFAQPTPISKALEKLQGVIKGAQDWIDLTSTILQFYRDGILIDETQNVPTLNPVPYGFDAAPIHAAMLNDRTRTAAFLDGIRAVVRPGDVVVDIGTGTGILAIAAARAGARHVYAVEASGIAESARAMFEANDLADRITLVQGWSTQIDLPERADVLVSEIIGNEPLGERVLEVMSDAVKRLLKPDARLIPSRLDIFGLPVTIPRSELVKRTFTPEALQNWRSWYEIDFSLLGKVARISPHAFYIRPHTARDWKSLSEPVLLAKVDFKSAQDLIIDNTTKVTAKSAGQLDGLIIYFELELGPKIRLSTAPVQTDEDCSWRSRVWVFAEPLHLQVGEQFAVTYKYRTGQAHDRVSVSRI